MSLRPRQVDFDAVWKGIKQTSLGVITLESIERETWNDRFADVYALCVAYPEPQAARLYAEVRSFLKDHVEGLQQELKTSESGDVLSIYHRYWLVYDQGLTFLDKLFMYLNIQHLKKKKMSLAELIYGSFEIDNDNNILEIRELGLYLWRRHMIELFQTELVSLLLDRINSFRRGTLQESEQNIIRDVIHSFVVVEEFKVNPLELYETVFECAYLRSSGEYFDGLASQLLQEHNVFDYMARVLQITADERLRCIGFLNASSVNRALAELRARLIEDHLTWILAETPFMVSEERHDDLKNLYELLKPLHRSEPLQTLTGMVEEHIRKKGVHMISAARATNDPTAFVDIVLVIYNRYTTMVSQVFCSDQLFFGALCRACTSVVNYKLSEETHCPAPELLVRYCDTLLKKSTKGVSETSLEEKLGCVVTIFKFVEDKDAFQKYYQKFLCKRLMYDSTISLDSEELMVAKFKQTCGYDFTNKLTQMLRDMNVSVDHTNKFLAHLSSQNISLQHSICVKVIQSGAWPIPVTSIVSFNVPQQMEQCVHNFEVFYKGKFNGRKLSWLHHLSQAELRLGYLSRMYLVTLHIFAMSILVLFESADTLTLDEIQRTTALPSDHLTRNMQALVDARLLVTSAPTSSVYSLNLNFSCKRTRFRVQTTPPVRERQVEAELTQREVDEGRKICLQAAVVRIMKARKRLRHNDLVQEVLGQTSSMFVPQVHMIKKCLDMLIDKEYIVRVAGSNDEYSYVA